jgi:hypothetical protein
MTFVSPMKTKARVERVVLNALQSDQSNFSRLGTSGSTCTESFRNGIS